MYIKHIAILAKSAKNLNFCVAGISRTGEWVRPISQNAETAEAVSHDAMVYPSEIEPNILDVVEIKFLKTPVNNPFQPENIFYDEEFFWQKVNSTTLEKIIKWRGFDHREKIFYNYDRRVDAGFVQRQDKRESLLLLPVKNLFIKIVQSNTHKKFYANFIYNGRKYFKFSVGDIAVRNNFENHGEGEYFFRESAVVLFSLTNPYKDNRCYKIVAQVF